MSGQIEESEALFSSVIFYFITTQTSGTVGILAFRIRFSSAACPQHVALAAVTFSSQSAFTVIC
jgi:hypothetical protein